MNFKDITITSLETITAFDVLTGDYKFTLDELHSATISQSQEATEITGKAGRKLASLKRNKAVSISGTNGLVSGGLLEIQTGGTFENKVTEVMWTDYLTVSVGAEDGAVPTATTTFVATGTTGAEIEALYVKDANGVIMPEKVLTQASTAATGKYAYDPATKKITFAAGDVTNGTEIVVYYKRKIKADVLENNSDVYSGKCALFIDALAEDKCSKVYRVQFYIPKADFSGEFSFDMGDNQTVHAFDAESLAGACGAGGSLWTYTIFGANDSDYTET